MGIGKKMGIFLGMWGIIFCAVGQDPAAATENIYDMSAEKAYQAETGAVITKLQVGSTVTKGGNYQIDPEAKDGEIHIQTTEDVTLTGSGVGELRNAYLTIAAEVPGVHITIEDIDIRNATAKPVNTMRFTGTGNRLTIQGTNYFGECIQESSICSVINVEKGADLTIDGDGILYITTHSPNAAAIGGDTDQGSGKIVFDGATVLIDTFMGGMAVGSDRETNDKQIGEIIFRKGEVGIYGTNSLRPQLGSRMSLTGQNITFEGGIVTLYNEKCCSIGTNRGYKGTVVVEGGLLLDSSNVPVDPLVVDREGNKLYRCPLQLNPEADRYKVDVDGKTYYEGDGLIWNDTDIIAEGYDKWEKVPIWDQAYVYLSGKKHQIMINGEEYTASFDTASGTFTLEEGWIPESPVPTEAAESPVPTEVPESPVPTESAESPVPTEIPESPVPTESAESPVPTEIPESPVPTESAESPVPTEIPESPVPTEIPESPAPTEAIEKPAPTGILVKPEIKLGKTSLTLYTKASKSAVLKVSVNGRMIASKQAKWSSSKPKVAAVNQNGKITAKKAGKTIITASINGGKATCEVTVKKPSLKLRKSSGKVKKGKTIRIAATALPSGKITYKTDSSKTVSINKNGVVKGKKKGKARITVKCNGIKKVFRVTVR